MYFKYTVLCFSLFSAPGVVGVLNQVGVEIINQERCNSSQYYNGILTPRMVCAGFETGGKDTCQVLTNVFKFQ